MNLMVKLVTTAASPLTVTPDDDAVSANSSGVTLTWQRDTSGDGFTFSSTSISGLPSPLFSSPSYNSGNNTVTVTDNYRTATLPVEYPYTLQVTGSDGNTYIANAANGNPRIKNN